MKRILYVQGVMRNEPTELEQLEGQVSKCYRIRARIDLSRVSHWYENKRFHVDNPGFTKQDITTIEMDNGSYLPVEMNLADFDSIMMNFLGE